MAAGIMAASAQGPPPLLPPKETHRYRIALPGLTGQNSPTIGGKGGRGEGRKGGEEEFSVRSREIALWRGPRETGLHERAQRASRADPIN